MKPRLPMPVSHTRCPLQIHRETLAILLILAFCAGIGFTVWFVVLVKGGVL